VGVFDELLEIAVLDLKTSSNLVVFWDVDAAATLDRVDKDKDDPFRNLISRYDAILTYGGGKPVVDAYRALGARECFPIYNALDPQTHFRVAPDLRFSADLAFLGNRLPDREARVDEFFLKPALLLQRSIFLLGGSGWADKVKPDNVNYLNHVYTADHNAFNSSPRMVLNVNRDSMARVGFSPATRVFEAAGAGACILTDPWEGVEIFFTPGTEILVAQNGEEVAEFTSAVSPGRANAIGEAARRRVLAEHTYAHRAAMIDQLLDANTLETAGALY
jgi:spore maturation protein CgeB